MTEKEDICDFCHKKMPKEINKFAISRMFRRGKTRTVIELSPKKLSHRKCAIKILKVMKKDDSRITHPFLSSDEWDIIWMVDFSEKYKGYRTHIFGFIDKKRKCGCKKPQPEDK